MEVLTHNSVFGRLMLMKLAGLKKCTENYDYVQFDSSYLKDNAAIRILNIYSVFLHTDFDEIIRNRK